MKRVVLKLSGEILGTKGWSAEKVNALADALVEAKNKTQLAIVLGAGNVWRGRDSKDFALSGTQSDALGMLGTLFNARLLTDVLLKKNIKARCFAPYALARIAEQYTPAAVDKALTEGCVCILGGGTGAPFFTTDTAAVLRALELEADAVLKGTKVDGVYDSDPQQNPNAIKFDQLSHQETIDQKIKVMDTTAFALAEPTKLPIFVFNAVDPSNIAAAFAEKAIGTWVR